MSKVGDTSIQPTTALAGTLAVPSPHASLNGLLFVGTDTGVGKSFVTAAVTRLLRRQGRPVSVCKPVATGGQWVGEQWVCEDTVCLAGAAGIYGDWTRVTPWAFPDPVAPPVAAKRQGVELSIVGLAEAIRQRQQSGAALLVEGVGGLLCPLTDRETVADLAALGLPLVVVARRCLGTLNHTLMTLEVALGRGLPVAGVVVSETVPPEGLASETNVAELQRRISVPMLAVVPHRTGPAVEEDVPGLAAIDWWRLCFPAETEIDR